MNTPRLKLTAIIAASLAIATLSTLAADEPNPWLYNKLLPSDRLFLDWYVTYFFYGPTNPALDKIGLGLSAGKPAQSTRASELQRRSYIASLPVKEQARLFLLSSLAVPFDGEYEEYHWGFYFNDHKKEIYKLLAPLTEKDILGLCHNMGIDEGQGRYFYRHLHTWMKEK